LRTRVFSEDPYRLTALLALVDPDPLVEGVEHLVGGQWRLHRRLRGRRGGGVRRLRGGAAGPVRGRGCGGRGGGGRGRGRGGGGHARGGGGGRGAGGEWVRVRVWVVVGGGVARGSR